MTQILAPESADLAVMSRTIKVKSACSHDLSAMWRPMSVLTIPGHTLLTRTRGLVLGNEEKTVSHNLRWVVLLRIVRRGGGGVAYSPSGPRASLLISSSVYMSRSLLMA